MFKKVLIANRGEIAVRIIRTCRDMGIATVAVYSEVDRAAKHVRLADEARPIGAAPAAESYLRIDRILEAARDAGAEAIHPGYGFLSENPEFAESCARAGICFIGPSAGAIRDMGVKTRARSIMQAAGVPVVPGTPAATDAGEAAEFARAVGYPVMLKAAAGGGGMGMRLVEDPAGMAGAWSQARSEARQAFGDDAVYVEKAIRRPRHIEVQVLADRHGSAVHLGERECSLQRRHQKVLEESPSPFVESSPAVRDALCKAALAAAEAVRYVNAGTVEFLMDPDGRFYFLEMNTRLQVEHPVTELVTGIDLVREQIRIAAGEPLGLRQEDIRCSGHAIECRVYAEDPSAGFMPAPGRIERLALPGGPGVRVDSGAEQGWTVPLEYDPLIAKLCAWGPTRQVAIARMRRALQEFSVAGIATTLEFFRTVLGDRHFQAGDFDTSFVERLLAAGKDGSAAPDQDARLAAMLAAIARSRDAAAARPSQGSASRSLWKSRGWLDAARIGRALR